MPRYFFHVYEGETVITDKEGVELADNGSAIEEARSAAREILADAVAKGTSPNGRRIEVADGDGKTVYSLMLSELLK